jgi:moderate conductance mechanosensitive channel
MYGFGLFTVRAGVSAEGQFMGKVLDDWMNDIQDFVRTKLPHLVALAIVALVLGRILRIITHRMIRIAEQHSGDTTRISQVRTMAGVVRTTGLAIIAAIVGLQFLEALGVNIGPLLTSAGVAGVAIGLAAQNLVKDMLNGTMILVEDQFNVGNVVTVAGLTGTVETMSLRKTTVRGADGTLYVIPNSQITTVANQSADFSNATISVSVDFSADPNRVLEILTAVANDVRNLPEFKDLFLADPQILGVDSVKGSQLIFPVVFKTLPTKQYAPMREFQRRVRLALEENHMLPGDPMRVFNSFDGGGESTAAVVSEHEVSTSAPKDPTTLKPKEENTFTGEG